MSRRAVFRNGRLRPNYTSPPFKKKTVDADLLFQLHVCLVVIQHFHAVLNGYKHVSLFHWFWNRATFALRANLHCVNKHWTRKARPPAASMSMTSLSLWDGRRLDVEVRNLVYICSKRIVFRKFYTLFFLTLRAPGSNVTVRKNNGNTTIPR